MRLELKNDKGVTMISLITYIIGFTIVIALIANLTTYFYKNINVSDINNDTTQYTKFSSLFTEEINNKNNSVIDCKSITNGVSYIIFSSGNQYTFDESSKSIYKNNVKICNNVDICDFSYTFVDSKYKIKVSFKTSNIEMLGDNAVIYNL